jgi:hypothetical protein
MGRMGRLRIHRLLVAVASIAAVCAPGIAQSVSVASEGAPKVTQGRLPERPIPFSPLSGEKTQGIEYRGADEMTENDRALVADAESSIREHTGRIGLEFNGDKWRYQQVLCPALPNHVFLRFTRNNGVGDVSVFSASIPRGGDGRVRIIPILLRGYSLWSPAPINSLTISAFNHIRAEEHADHVSDWLGTGLCYASLAGGHPVPARFAENPAEQKFPLAAPAKLEIPLKGGGTVSFADVAAAPRPMEWTIAFDGKGKLLKATHTGATLTTAEIMSEARANVHVKGWPPAVASPPPFPLPEPTVAGNPAPQAGR